MLGDTAIGSNSLCRHQYIIHRISINANQQCVLGCHPNPTYLGVSAPEFNRTYLVRMALLRKYLLLSAGKWRGLSFSSCCVRAFPDFLGMINVLLLSIWGLQSRCLPLNLHGGIGSTECSVLFINLGTFYSSPKCCILPQA